MFEGLQTELEEVTEALAEVIARWVLPLISILIILDTIKVDILESPVAHFDQCKITSILTVGLALPSEIS